MANVAYLVDYELLDLGGRHRLRFAIFPTALLSLHADVVTIAFGAILGHSILETSIFPVFVRRLQRFALVYGSLPSIHRHHGYFYR